MTDTSRTSNMAKSEFDMKKVKEIPLVHDQGLFAFDTGDSYEGFFEAKKKDRSVKMHGYGTYTTAEGDTYFGAWESDKLGRNEEVTITFIDGATYRGLFKEWCYSGKGNYEYPDGCVLECDFQENIPINGLKLTDPNGHVWLGKAEQGFGWFTPVNHFFEVLEKPRDPNKGKKRAKVEPPPKPPTMSRSMVGRKSKVVMLPKEK